MSVFSDREQQLVRLSNSLTGQVATIITKIVPLQEQIEALELQIEELETKMGVVEQVHKDTQAALKAVRSARGLMNKVNFGVDDLEVRAEKALAPA